MLRAGFASEEITPRIGVELSGYGPYMLRVSDAVHEPLHARALVLDTGSDSGPIALVACDLIGMTAKEVEIVRNAVRKGDSRAPSIIHIGCTHTHSGPNPTTHSGWGEADPSYREIVPFLIARAVLAAWRSMVPTELAAGEGKCENFAVNRIGETKRAIGIRDLRAGAWKPAKPELTDVTCPILRFSDPKSGRLQGFIASFGCHPVVCGETTHRIHGDFCGGAVRRIESENPGAIGLFLQAAHGDINPCFCHGPESDSFEALDILSRRFATTLREGLGNASPISNPAISSHSKHCVFPRKPWTRDELESMLREHATIFSAESNREILLGPVARRNTVILRTLRNIIARLDRGEPVAEPTELTALQIGTVTLLGSGFELYRKVGADIRTAANAAGPVHVCSLLNDGLGYAVDQNSLGKSGYTAEYAPFILGTLPYQDLHGHLVEEFTLLLKDRSSTRI
jgi:hypothetical protein